MEGELQRCPSFLEEEAAGRYREAEKKLEVRTAAAASPKLTPLPRSSDDGAAGWSGSAVHNW